MAARDRQKTAFATPWGLFKFTRMPFGLHGAVATFQWLVDHTLAPHTMYAAAYINDVVIYSQTWEQHLRHVGAVLQELHQIGMTINPEKCALRVQETNYLGFRVGQGIIRPLASKIEIIENYLPPQTKWQMCSFLGLANNYRRFSPCFAEKAAT